ncbi:MAG: 50S ribosomal protein L32 [Thermodesulfobacteriota bacterium]
MAVPKRRQSRTRRDKRRSHDHLVTPGVSKCPQCNEPKAPHRACPKCGFYKGREVLQVK